MSRLYLDLLGAGEALNTARQALELAQDAIAQVGNLDIETVANTARLVVSVKPLSGTTVGVASFSIVGNGTNIVVGGASVSHPALATTNVLSAVYRTRIVSAAGAGSAASIRQNLATVLRGSTAGQGGFRVVMRFGSNTALAQQRAFFGLTDSTGALANANPSTFTNIIGVGYDSAETNFSLLYNDGSGTATKTSLGGSFPVDTSSFYELRIEAEPNASSVLVILKNIGTGATSSNVINTNLPANTVFLAAQMWLNNGTTAAGTNLDINCMYVEYYS